MRPSLILLLACLLLPCLPAADIVLPDDRLAVMNAITEGGAKGDGVADDTDALQKAIEACCTGQTRFLFLPVGTYRITRSLIFRPNAKGTEGSMMSPWMYGQDRERTIIRLADGAAGFADPAKPQAAIRGLSRPDGAKMNADFFDRTMVNLTIDTGKNAGAVGIAFYSNNTGLMHEITIRGNGPVGIDLGTHDQNGPLLIQDVSIAGFATGISTGNILNSQTLSRVSIRARAVGLKAEGQVLAVEGLDIQETPLPVACGDQTVLSLTDCRFKAPPGSTGPAITLGKGTLYLQRLVTSGYAVMVAGTERAPSGPKVAEWSSHDPIALGANSPGIGLGLTPLREPDVRFPTKADQWVCANDFGAAFGDEEDDGPAIQRAVDAAAAKGAKAVYLRGNNCDDPNWYWLKSDVKIHGSVERLMGFGFARILGGDHKSANYPENLGKFVVADDPTGAPVVMIQHLKVFSPWPSLGFENRSRSRTLVLRSLEGTAIARAGCRIFVTNLAGFAHVETGATMYARQCNTENTVAGGAASNILNDGGSLWILGLKTEARGIKLTTRSGGRTEVVGAFNYNTSGVTDDTPFFKVDDSALSVSGYREVNWAGQWWPVTVQATQNGAVSRLPPKAWHTWALLRTGK